MEFEHVKRSLSRVFIFTLVWSFGAAIDSVHQSKFETFLMSEFNMNDLPKGSAFDYKLKTGGQFGQWESWSKVMPEFVYSKDIGFFELVVPTKDTVKFSWVLKNSLKHSLPIFLTGVTGVGKSIIINSTLEEMKEHENFENIFMSFSSQTSSKETQTQIEDKLEKRRRNLLAGPANRKVALFIDDVNMPDKDEYGT
jgi:dynein heavy chain